MGRFAKVTALLIGAAAFVRALLPGAKRRSAQSAKNKIKQWIAACVAATLILAGGIIFMGVNSQPPAQPDQKIMVEVTEGMNVHDIAALLESKGIIGSQRWFYLQAKIDGVENKFRKGRYVFYPGMPSSEIMEGLMAGTIEVFRVTIPEGYDVKQIAQRLGQDTPISEGEFLRLAKNARPYPYIEKHEDTSYAIEGFLFPATYEFKLEDTAEDVLDRMAEVMDERLTPEIRSQAQAKNLSIYKLITLASLVEREARFDEDRPIIAQIFLKRLSINMPLQSCATIQYLLNEPKAELSIADTNIDSPYNTYQEIGLPPGPIASPGIKSIEAVLHPADTDYLYFVADHDGHHHYATNYDEHLRLIDEVR